MGSAPYTVHLRAERRAVLVPESFSWPAALLGPLWLAVHSAWIAAGLALCAEAAVVGLTQAAAGCSGAGAGWGLGLFSQDFRRGALARRGFVLSHVVAAATGDDAVQRLLDQRPELVREAVA